MAPPDKNLFEVFQRLDESGVESSREAPVPAPPRRGRGRRGRRAADLPARLAVDGRRRLLLEAIAVLVAFGIGAFLGSSAARSARPLEASERAEPASEARAPFVAPPPAGIRPPSEDEVAGTDEAGRLAPLYDPANRYTLVAITYDAGMRWEDRAWEVHDHFRAAGLPAFPPIQYAGKICVLVGAEPTQDALRPFQERLRALPDPAGREGAFETCYVNSIDNMIQR